jgi:hypothetical protein
MSSRVPLTRLRLLLLAGGVALMVAFAVVWFGFLLPDVARGEIGWSGWVALGLLLGFLGWMDLMKRLAGREGEVRR